MRRSLEVSNSSSVAVSRELTGNSLNNFANLHVIMAIQNTEFFEVLLPAESKKYGLAQDIEIDSDGMVHAPTGPGLGAAIDFELIQRNQLLY